MKTLIIVLALMAPGCSAAAKNAVATGVTVAVDTCQEIANFVPPSTAVGAVVGLTCQAIEAGAPAIEVIIDSNLWNSMKASYQASHGSLPKGMSPVPVSYPTAGAPLPDKKP